MNKYCRIEGVETSSCHHMGVSAFCRDHCENYRIKQSLAGSESGVRLFHLWGGNQAIASRI
ncbi:hypothetical protein HanXRQr2_Chr16g0746321 [Helianthus annuus]|uniref:Uncharacterized protein n=1 Tax=Helianthus annuus TaxID=4232 RepID=A0A251RYU6_HELAN|nr:hypothetical protein HanXRQr2_Chr16g0746321 [Helianthus annuus]